MKEIRKTIDPAKEMDKIFEQVVSELQPTEVDKKKEDKSGQAIEKEIEKVMEYINV